MSTISNHLTLIQHPRSSYDNNKINEWLHKPQIYLILLMSSTTTLHSDITNSQTSFNIVSYSVIFAFLFWNTLNAELSLFIMAFYLWRVHKSSCCWNFCPLYNWRGHNRKPHRSLLKHVLAYTLVLSEKLSNNSALNRY